MKKTPINQPALCPCGSEYSLQNCCQPYLSQSKNAATAENLMRSRYTAFVLNDEAYLRFSWHPNTCPKTIHLDAETSWLGLSIKSREKGQPEDDTGSVEFVARYKKKGKAVRLHENSRFVKLANRWLYLDGKNGSEQ